MNAAIRAVVRMGVSHKWEVYGVHRGYQGLIDDDIEQMTSRSVSGILQKGGTRPADGALGALSDR